MKREAAGVAPATGGARVARVARRLARHELLSYASIGLWLARRRHGLRPGDREAPYAAEQASTVLLFGLVCLIETVALAYLIPWPLVHLVVLVIDIQGLVFVLGLHASSVVRPHVLGPDGSLRVRYATLVDLHVPASHIEAVRLDRRYPGGGLTVDAGTLSLPVAGLTNITVHLSTPVTLTRPLGTRTPLHTLHLHTTTPATLTTR